MTKQERMCEDLTFFVECVSGRKIDPMTPTEIMSRNKEICAMEFQFYEDFLNASSELELMGAKIPSTIGSYVITNTANTIAPCQTTACAPSHMHQISYGCVPINQEGEKPMCYPQAKTNFNSAAVVTVGQPSTEATQRDFFSERIRQVTKTHESDLRDQFHVDTPEGPRTAKELIKAITDGEYTLDQKMLDKHEEEELKYYNVFYGLRWSKNLADPKGFEEARKVLKTEAQNVIDAGTLSDVAGLLTLLKDFQNWKFEAKVEKAKK